MKPFVKVGRKYIGNTWELHTKLPVSSGSITGGYKQFMVTTPGQDFFFARNVFEDLIIALFEGSRNDLYDFFLTISILYSYRPRCQCKLLKMYPAINVSGNSCRNRGGYEGGGAMPPPLSCNYYVIFIL